MQKQHELSVYADPLFGVATNDSRKAMSKGEGETNSLPHVPISAQSQSIALLTQATTAHEVGR